MLKIMVSLAMFWGLSDWLDGCMGLFVWCYGFEVHESEGLLCSCWQWHKGTYKLDDSFLYIVSS